MESKFRREPQWKPEEPLGDCRGVGAQTKAVAQKTERVDASDRNLSGQNSRSWLQEEGKEKPASWTSPSELRWLKT